MTSSRSSRARVAMAHPVDLLVDRAFLLDEGVGARHIGFRLVIIVIGHEIFHGVVREKVLELAVKLRRQVLFGARIEGRRCLRAITCAMVKVLPEPVTPSSTWSRSCASIPPPVLRWRAAGRPAANIRKPGRNGRRPPTFPAAPDDAASRLDSAKARIALFEQLLQNFGGGGGTDEFLARRGAADRPFAGDFRLLAEAVARGLLGVELRWKEGRGRLLHALPAPD